MLLNPCISASCLYLFIYLLCSYSGQRKLWFAFFFSTVLFVYFFISVSVILLRYIRLFIKCLYPNVEALKHHVLLTVVIFTLSGPDIPGFLLQPFRKPKRIRTAFSPSQLLKLEHAFEKNHYVVGAERKQLAQSLSLTETQVTTAIPKHRSTEKYSAN